MSNLLLILGLVLFTISRYIFAFLKMDSELSATLVMFTLVSVWGFPPPPKIPIARLKLGLLFFL